MAKSRRSQKSKIPKSTAASITPIADRTEQTIQSPRIEDNPFFSLQGTTEGEQENVHNNVMTQEGTEESKQDRDQSEDDPPSVSVDDGIKYTLEEDFEDLLRAIFSIRDDDENHELLQSLQFDGITSWTIFRQLQPIAIEELTKPSIKDKRVPIGKGVRMQLAMLLQYVREKIDNKEPNARKIQSYDPDEFEEYLDAHYREMQQKATDNPENVKAPPAGGSTFRSRTEKALDNWDKRKLDKTNFDIIRDDSRYKTWRESFVAEIKVQGLLRMIDPNFNKKDLKDSFDRELFDKQSNYMWTVLLYALHNPIAEVVLGKHRDNSDARTAFLAVDDKMKGTTSQLYDVSSLSDTLRDLHISTFKGNRVQFVAHWFETLRQLNKIEDKADQLPFIHIRSMIMRAVDTDRDLTHAFTELKEEPDRDLATAKLMDHLLEKAILFDGRDGNKSNSDTNKLRALMHKMGLSDDYEILVHKSRRGPPEDCKLPSSLYSSFSLDDKRAWRDISDDVKRLIIQHLSVPPDGNARTQRQAYFHGIPPVDTTNQSAIVDVDTVRSVAHDAVSAMRHTIATAEAKLRALEQSTDKSTEFTAMSSITSGSRPPPSQAKSLNKTPDSDANAIDEDNENAVKDDRPKKSSMHQGHPARYMATKTVIDNDINHDDLQTRNVSFYGGEYKNFKHHLFYSHAEREMDTNTTDTVIFNVSRRKINGRQDVSLVDRGANGCVAGADCTWIGGPFPERKVHITGMDDHQVCDIPVGTVGAYVESNRGPVICIFNEVAYTGRGQSILSSIQLEHFRNRVDDRALGLGGGQQITTADGYNFPLSIINGLAYLQMRAYTRSEYNSLPHVIMTSEQLWDPRMYDKYINPRTRPYKSANPKNLHLLPHAEYDVKGEYIGANRTEVKTAKVKFWLHDSEYQHGEIISRCIHSTKQERNLSDHLRYAFDSEIEACTTPRTHMATDHDYERMKPYFAWIPIKLIRKTFANSTQYGYQPISPDGNLFKRWNSPNPAMNIFRLQDDLLTDKIHSNTPSLEGGFTDAQVFFGRKSHIIHPEPISKTKTFLRCLQNFVRKWGAPIRLLADHVQYHASFQVLDYLRILWIQLWFSEAYYQHQNPFERRYQTFKRIVNRTMDRTATPPQLWFLCMCHVAYVLNRVSDPSLGYRQPILVATGSMGDISSILSFQWLEPVYYKIDDKQPGSFPDTPEAIGYFVGIAESVGHAMTYRLWNKSTNCIIERSSVRSAWDERFPNYRASNIPHDKVTPHSPSPEETPKTVPHNTDKSGDRTPAINHPENTGETSESPSIKQYVFSKKTTGSSRDRDNPNDGNYGEQHYLYEGQGDPPNDDETIDITSGIHYDEKGAPMVVLLGEDGNPKLDTRGNAIMIPGQLNHEIQGKSFKRRFDDGSVLRARVVGPTEENLYSHDGKKVADRFRIKYDRTQVEDTMAYNDIMNYIHREQEEDQGIIWKFLRIISHRPVTHRDPKYKNCTYNVTVEWENGEITEEALSTMITEHPIIVAQYAKDFDLLDVPGWKRLQKIADREQLFKRLVKQVRLRSFRTAPKYMYGFQVPRDYKEALEFDKRNGNTRWADATALEMEQLREYQVFIDKGLFYKVRLPPGFKKIRVHLVFAVKHDGRHKARLVADGHLTDIPLDSVYAGVVSIRGLRMVLFLAELNGLQAYATDIGNAYLEAVTHEKVCIHAGPEFGELQGHLLIIYKALYGLRSSGKQFGDLLAACLKELGFKPSLSEPQIFLRRNGEVYEYVATYVDDLCLAMKDPEAFLQVLQSKPYSFKLKGSGPMSFHLGCGFVRDQLNTLCMDPTKYIEKVMQAYEQLFGVKPGSKPRSPLEEGDHPELDTSELLDEEDTQKYQSLIGSLQWLVTLGRFDIQPAVMTLSSFRAKPRKGHLLRARRVCAYVNRFRSYKIRFRTEEPDLSNLDNAAKVDWSKDVYGDQQEELPGDMPEPLGKRVTLVHWFDANLMHDVLSGKAVTGCIHFANKTPIMWYSKKQATTETATYGAEFCAGRTCVEQLIDLRNSFRYLGVPIHDISYVFGDNKSMIDSATYPYARLHKRHNILSYHYVRSMISRGFIALSHINSADNLADVLSKHWGYNSVKGLLKPVFDHMGDTAELYIDDD